MKNIPNIFLLLLALCSLGMVAKTNAQTLANSAPTARIGGKIVNQEGKPVPGAVLCLSNGQEVRADENALFSIETPANSPCMITIDQKGYKLYRRLIQVTDAETLVLVVKLTKEKEANQVN